MDQAEQDQAYAEQLREERVQSLRDKNKQQDRESLKTGVKIAAQVATGQEAAALKTALSHPGQVAHLATRYGVGVVKKWAWAAVWVPEPVTSASGLTVLNILLLLSLMSDKIKLSLWDQVGIIIVDLIVFIVVFAILVLIALLVDVLTGILGFAPVLGLDSLAI